MERTVINALFNNAALLLVLSVIYEASCFLPLRYRRMQPVINGVMLMIRNLLSEEMKKEDDPHCNKDRTRVIELEHYRADGTTIWVAMKMAIALACF